MHQALGVRVGRETMTGSLQPRAQRLEVVELAVEDRPDGPVLVGNRLVAAGDVDDAQAAIPDAPPAARSTDAPAAKRCLRRPGRDDE